MKLKWRTPKIVEIKQGRVSEMMLKVKQEAEAREKQAKRQRFRGVGYASFGKV